MARARRAKTKAVPANGMTTYLMNTTGGQQRKVTVPSGWRVTFGPTVPYERHASGARGDGTWALRFYDGQALKAIYTDVKNFRDTAIDTLEKVVKTQRQAFTKDGKQGGKQVIAEARIEEWIDPDEPESEETPEEFLTLDFKPVK